jgi:hypothetical protein
MPKFGFCPYAPLHNLDSADGLQNVKHISKNKTKDKNMFAQRKFFYRMLRQNLP